MSSAVRGTARGPGSGSAAGPVAGPRRRRGRAGGVGWQGDVGGSTGNGLRHFALLYHDLDEYSLAIADFLQAGAEAGEPALVAVPGSRQERLRLALEQRRASGELPVTTGGAARAGGPGETPTAGVTTAGTPVPT